jgi:hypothetical protein
LASSGANGPATPRFGRLPANAIQGFIGDTMGVYVPKLPFMRSKAQFFEETFLEFVEDGAFYFTVPVVGELLAKGMQRLAGLPQAIGQHLPKQAATKTGQDWIGTALADWQKTHAKALSPQAMEAIYPRLVAAKAGTLLGVVGIAAGYEYLIQHVKNMITARAFKTKNFTAVAGLEPGRLERTRDDEHDPVVRGQHRLKQVPALTAGVLAASLALPSLLRRGGQPLKVAENLMQWVDFKRGSVFDLSNPILATTVLSGVASYLDAARDGLERKETATRLGIVVPYLLAGRQLAGNALAWFQDNKPMAALGNQRPKDLIIGRDAQGKPIHFSFLDKKFHWKTPFTPARFLDFDAVRPLEAVLADLKQLPKTLENPELAKALLAQRHGSIGTQKFMLSALGMTAGVCLLTYSQTRARYKRLQERLAAQRPPAAASPWQPPGSSWPAGQGGPPTPQPLWAGSLPGGGRPQPFQSFA